MSRFKYKCEQIQIFYVYIHKSYDTDLQYWQKLHTTILLGRYHREQTTMTTPGPFEHIN